MADERLLSEDLAARGIHLNGMRLMGITWAKITQSQYMQYASRAATLEAALVAERAAKDNLQILIVSMSDCETPLAWLTCPGCPKLGDAESALGTLENDVARERAAKELVENDLAETKAALQWVNEKFWTLTE